MVGELIDGEILVQDEREASQIYEKGQFGTPQSGGGLKLDLMEGIYLKESGRLEVMRKGRKVKMERLIRLANGLIPCFEIKYLVYRDLRQRGYVVKGNIPPLDFRVFPRGGGPNRTPSKYWVCALSERSVFDLEELTKILSRVMEVRKELLLAVVDEESDLTYYVVQDVRPKGRVPQQKLKLLATATFLEDRSLVLDPEEAKRLHETEFFGKMVGNRLQLSLLETAHLLKRGVIEVRNARTGRKMGLERFMREARKVQPDFDLRLRVYEDLKDRGIVVKTGFKYGSHFRAYVGRPDRDHAKYLVHAFPHNYRGMWPEISRAVRLAHGVKKTILLGRVGNNIRYIRLQRVRP